MSSGTRKKKLQMMDFPDIPKTTTNNVSQNYNTFSNDWSTSKIKKRKVTKNVKGFNTTKVIIGVFYIMIVVVAAMIMTNASNSVDKLGREKNAKQKELNELKTNVENLENETISKNDFAQKKEEAIRQGFVEKNSLKYIRLDK